MHEGLIRRAVPGDAAAIAALHAASWRSAYRGILPDAFLDGPIAANRRAVWEARLPALAPGDVVLLAPGHGFAAAFACQDGDALLDNLHVAPVARGGGLGAALLRAVAAGLLAGGARAMHLWVFDANPRARAFYARHGGVETGRRLERLAGIDVPETRIAWRDLAPLAQAPR
jgi:GNAT superfamily N-acetyltransferase